MDSHLTSRMWPQWSHLSPLRLGADSLWLPSGASHVLTPREAGWHIGICSTGRPHGKGRGSLQLTPSGELRPFPHWPESWVLHSCQATGSHRLPSRACRWDHSPGPHLDYSLWDPESEAHGRAMPRFHTHTDYGVDSYALKPLHFEVIWSMAVDN